MTQGILDTEALELWHLAQQLEQAQGLGDAESERGASMAIVAFIRDFKLEAFRERPWRVEPTWESAGWRPGDYEPPDRRPGDNCTGRLRWPCGEKIVQGGPWFHQTPLELQPDNYFECTPEARSK